MSRAVSILKVYASGENFLLGKKKLKSFQKPKGLAFMAAKEAVLGKISEARESKGRIVFPVIEEALMTYIASCPSQQRQN